MVVGRKCYVVHGRDIHFSWCLRWTLKHYRQREQHKQRHRGDLMVAPLMGVQDT